MAKERSFTEKEGYFGDFGGRYAPEILTEALIELEGTYEKLRKDKKFKKELEFYRKNYIGRPSPVTFAERLTQAWGGARIWLKREDLNHTGAHKINNTIGQALIAKAMGKRRIIAETGAGQHGVATATVGAMFQFETAIFMGEEDLRRQKLNAIRMEMLGAKVIGVSSGTATLKDATSEAMRDWALNVSNTHYIVGSVIGPHPFPTIVRDFQKVIGEESRKQFQKENEKLPDAVVACVGGGSNAMGMFYGFLKDKKVKLYGVEAGGRGSSPGEHSATMLFGKTGFLHGTKTLVIQDEGGQVVPAHSVSAGLDYPGVGPEHAYLHSSGRVKYETVSDEGALDAFMEVCRIEGIIPALETAHAFHFAKELAKDLGKKKDILICLSGRGDKDVAEVARLVGLSKGELL
ncbi:tryptophan synthase subunit beta [Leptospira wolffii]|uniref:tryptophan synthase subunit beta n=1 Tax=Leptospira wolffii TaxID=409998 RepID=UPI001083C28A|nr:tryptophan synthase subunit beta [Leptospira wolffii]TGK56117.1 tryptophan synthase subunit beta [Leptospira wolffii]TGK72163.1 tryptophan synthase subunit beta [Leptospira wolffii]TGK77467.1 tryptophan synthase subunit beta [Leptospira wolffii]TGL27740.1 tryptophan synthase subunit beta [Leptospira wolffii]